MGIRMYTSKLNEGTCGFHQFPQAAGNGIQSLLEEVAWGIGDNSPNPCLHFFIISGRIPSFLRMGPSLNENNGISHFIACSNLCSLANKQYYKQYSRDMILFDGSLATSLFGKVRGLLFDVVGEKRVEWDSELPSTVSKKLRDTFFDSDNSCKDPDFHPIQWSSESSFEEKSSSKKKRIKKGNQQAILKNEEYREVTKFRDAIVVENKKDRNEDVDENADTFTKLQETIDITSLNAFVSSDKNEACEENNYLDTNITPESSDKRTREQ
ncbi:hypothetical protein ANN_19392 [Periplaneta americana]|uniref:Uncharacterized protein n=1 Tax=Periplaneta americana TaxID=6978 RepID=A0ABQ8SA91_PERAM|nr:hypothetical protein ANN_19392 [Periplaneta americana]